MPLCGENAFGCVKLQVWNRIKWGEAWRRTWCREDDVSVRRCGVEEEALRSAKGRQCLHLFTKTRLSSAR